MKKIFRTYIVLSLGILFWMPNNIVHAQNTGSELKAKCNQLSQASRKDTCKNYADQMIDVEKISASLESDLLLLNDQIENYISIVATECPPTDGTLPSGSCSEKIRLINQKQAKQNEINAKQSEINQLRSQINAILNDQDNFSDEKCKNLSILIQPNGNPTGRNDASDSQCALTAGCQVKYHLDRKNSMTTDYSKPLSCIKDGVFGAFDGENAAQSDFAKTHCRSKYTEPSDWSPQEKLEWPMNNIWTSIRMNNGTNITEAMGRATYNESIEKLENRCDNDDLCYWMDVGPKDKRCTHHLGSGSLNESDIIRQQELNQKKIQCEKFNRDDSWGLNVASTPEDRTQAMLQRDEQCYRTEGCTMSENLDHWDQEYHAGEKIPGCTVDMGEYLGEKQLTEFNAFDTYKGPIFYGPGLRAGARIAKTKLDNTISKERSLQNLILGWTKFALSMTATLAVVALIYAGILYVTDFGQGSNKEKAQKIIQYVVTGIIVIFGSYGIVNTLMKARFGNQIGAIAYQETYEAENFALKI